MPPHPPALPRLNPDSLIELLRDDADDESWTLENDGLDSSPTETTSGEAAQLIEEWNVALTQIAAGAPDPQQIARDALKMEAPRKVWGTPDDTIRDLLKPQSE